MATAAQLSEIVAKLQQLETEQTLLKDLFTRASTSSSERREGSARLNFREAEKQMPQEYGGKGVNFAEFCFKIEAYMTALDPDGPRRRNREESGKD